VAKGDLQYQVGFDVDLGEIQRLQRALAAGGEQAAKDFNAALGGTVTKQIVFETRADGNGVKQLIAVEKERLSVADAYVSKLNQIQKIEAGSVTSLRQQVNQAKQARDEIAKYATAIGPLGGQVNTVTAAWAAQNTKVAQLQRSLDEATASGFWDRAKTGLNAGGLINFANGLTQITNGLQSASIVVGQIAGSINGLVNALGDLQSFALAFKAVGQGAGGAGLALAESSRIALGLGVDLKTVRQGFQQLTPVVLNAGGTIGEVSNVVEALSSRFAAFGISGDRARRVTNGVIQAFAKGRLQAEELTQQISEADPAFKTDFAGALKVTVAQLEQLVKAGEITGDVLLKTLPKIGKSALLFGNLGTSAVDAANSLGKTGVTVDQVRSKINTISQLSFEEFAKSIEPVLVGFLRFGAIITDSLSRISKLQGIDALGAIGGKLLESFGRLADAFINTAEAGLIIVDIVARIAGAFASLPGVTDVIAIAIAGKLIAPLAALKSAFGKSVTDATGWGRAIRAATTFSGFSQALSGIRDSIGNLFTGANSSAAGLAKINAEQVKLASKAAMTQAAIDRLTTKIEGYRSTLQAAQRTPGIGGGATQGAIDAYTKKISKARDQLTILQNSLGQINSAQAANSAALSNAANKTNIFQRSIGGLRGVFNATGAAGAKLVGILGPIGVALASIAVFTSAYRTATESSNAVLDESRGRVDALKAALSDLTGETGKQKEPVTGLGLVWAQFSFLVLDAANSIKGVIGNIFDGFDPKAKKAATGIAGVIDQVGRFLAAAGAGALAGALIFGGLSGGTLAPVGAAVGAVVAAIAAFTAGGGDAAVQTRKLQEEVKAAGQAIQAEAGAIRALLAGVTKGGTIKLDINNAGALAAFRQAGTALDLLEKNLEGLKGQKGQLQETAKALQPPQEVLQAYGAIEAQQKKIVELEKRRSQELKTGKIDPKLGGEIQKAIADLALLKEKAAELSKVAPDSAKYRELQTQIAILNKEINASEVATKAARDAYDALARESGLLTSEQKETISTVSGLNEQLKNLKTTLESDINPKSNPAKWEEISRAIAQTTVELNALQDAAADSTSKELVYEIKAKIQEGEIANSVANVQRLVQALEERATVLDINSPELYNVLQDLEQAKSKTEELNGKQASIRVDILEAGGAGSTIATLSEIGRYIDALEQKKLSLSIGSAEIDGVIQKQNEAKALQDAGTKSSAELSRFLRTEELNEKKAAIEQVRQAERQAGQDRVYALQEELRQVKEIADKRIKSLQELTPAEGRLAELRRQELEKQARGGKTEIDRVSAQAQLERLDREKEIKRIQEEAAAEEKRIQDALRAEAATQREQDIKYRDEALEVDKELLEIAKEERKEKIEAAKQVLEARQKDATAAGDAATAQETGAGFASETQESLEAARTAVDELAKRLLDLDGKEIKVNVKLDRTPIPSRWTGGPVSSGQAYQVNELGQEGFLSAGGRLSAINKPKNALWRAPSSGTVIPAHIWSGLDIPSGGVRTSARPMAAGSGGNGLQRVVRAIQASLTQPRESSSSMHELATVQARQALEIGKLSRAVNKLADKDHTVNVAVRNTGSTAYLDALSRRF